MGGLGVSANQKTKGSDYIDLSVNYPVAEGWTVMGHYGHQKVKNYGDASYDDWKLGISKDTADKMVPAMSDYMVKGGNAEAADLFKGAIK